MVIAGLIAQGTTKVNEIEHILRGYENQLAALEVDYALFDNKESRPLLIGGREGAYTQTFKIEANGTSSIRKFGYKLERDRWLPFGTVSQTGEN